MKIRRKKLDIVFSNLVRERVNYTCQACCTNKRHEPSTLDCAHIMSRRSVGLRWHPRNAIALCRSCHMFYTDHPFDWSDWCRDQFGGDFVAELRLVSNKTVSWSTKLREDIYKHYKDQYLLMQTDRLVSELMIDFEPYELMHEFRRSA